MTEVTISIDKIEYIAKTGSAEDLIGLLNKYGDGHVISKKKVFRKRKIIGNNMDRIVEGVSHDCTGAKAEKLSIIADFIGKKGAFADNQTVPASVAQELRDNIADLTQGKADLTRQLEDLVQQVAGLQEIIENKLPTATPGKALLLRAPQS